MDNLTVSWNPNDKWIEKDENYEKLKSDFKNLEMKLIETLVDTTVLFDVCFKDKPFRKGDLALICLVDIGSTHQIYQPGMLHVKLLNQNDPCYFLFYNHIYHLEKNRNEYYQYIKSNKMPSEHLQ
uniref:hypothetical protein n=1 Tax=Flavobacterium sp. TaxID=239 RepID=UPI00404AA0D1